MTLSKQAKIIELVISGENPVRIRQRYGVKYNAYLDVMSKYFYKPALMPVEFIFESKMNDETVKDFK